MTFTSLLINTCTVQRFAEGAADDYGHPVKVWSDLHADIACRKVFGKGTEIKVGQEVRIVYEELYIKDQDVTPQDRVILDGDTYQILDVGYYQDGLGAHHRKLFIEKVE